LLDEKKLEYMNHMFCTIPHPNYNDYPVYLLAGVQADNYTAGRSDRVNEMIMVRKVS